MKRFLKRTLAVATAFAASTIAAGSASAADATVRTLFDGTKVEGLRGYKGLAWADCAWVIENGTLKTVPGAKKKCDLVTSESYADFDLSFEWKVSPGGNSGVMYDVTETNPESFHTGPEMQLLDDDKHSDGKIPNRTSGSLYALIAPTGKTLKPVGEFNQARLVKKGRKVQHWLNGVKVVKYELGSPALTALIADSKFKGMPRFAQEGQGHIAFQNHGEEIWFRNIRIKGTPAAPKTPSAP